MINDMAVVKEISKYQEISNIRINDMAVVKEIKRSEISNIRNMINDMAVVKEISNIRNMINDMAVVKVYDK